MQGRTYEVFVDGKPVGLVGSTINSLAIRRRNGYTKRFGPTVELRLIREVPVPVGYNKQGYMIRLRAAEAFDIASKKTYRDQGGLNKVSPLAQVIWSPSDLASIGGRLGGQWAKESGQLDRIRLLRKKFDNQSKEQYASIGIKGGKKRFELHGSPATIEGRRKGCYKRNELYGNPATPESCSKAGKIGTLKQPRWAKVYGAQVAMHNRWHVRRNIINPNCKICTQSPSGIEELSVAI